MAERTRTMVIRLPEASPLVYLAWMAYWRDVERVMIDTPALEAVASREGAPFVREPIADYLSDHIVPQIMEHASEAVTRHRAAVAPAIEVDTEKIVRGLDYILRRSRWLGRPGVHEALGIPPPRPDVVSLRLAAVRAILDQVDPRNGRSGREG